MDYNKLANLLYPNAKDINFWFKKYPKRNLKAGAEVTRLAPSPTGFLHIGSVYTALFNSKIAKQTGGLCFLRIEDTDQKRLVENGISSIVNGFKTFDVGFSEGVLTESGETGNYGPYVQTQRKEIYESFAKYLVEQGKAYPCFCSSEELVSLREKQISQKLNPGYYAEFATCRNLTFEQIEQNIKANKPWVLRFKCPYKEGDKMEIVDLVRGQRTIPCNYNDVIIMKSNGLPPYNLAHIVDDTLMGTTIVGRTDEWYSSLTEHLQLFQAFSLTPPKYIHASPIQKIDEQTGERRKISKRKDPEADVKFFIQAGYPTEGVFDYLMTLLNSNFEDWRAQNPKASIDEFVFDVKKLNVSGALFDLVKLNDICKNTISNFSAKQVYEKTLAWAEKFDVNFADLLKNNREYYINILNIDREIPKPRKDIAKWNEVKETYSYMFDDEFNRTQFVFPEKFTTEQIKLVLSNYVNFFNENDDQQTWFNRIKDLAEKIGWAREVKDFKKNPELYPAHCGDASTILRVALTGRTQTPNLYDICMLLGKNRINERINFVLDKLK